METNRLIIRFNIFNKQQDYAHSLSAMESLSEGKTLNVGSEFQKKMEYCFCNQGEVLSKEVLRYKYQKFSEKSIENQCKDIFYVFQVHCSDENDMTNLIYFCLVNDRFLEKCALFLTTSENEYKLMANVSNLFVELIESQKLKHCYILNKGKVRNINARTDRVLKKYSPIFIVDEALETASYWRKPVRSVLLDLYKKESNFWGNHTFLEDYFLPHIIPKILLQERNEQEKKQNKRIKDIQRGYASKSFEYWLFSIFSECFCEREGKENQEFSRKRYEWWKSNAFFDMVKDMPLLAMYIFCMSNHFSQDMNIEIMEDLHKEIFAARDMADGILQIIENVYHSEFHKGYFMFRVHTDYDNNQKNSYLHNNYNEYMADAIRGEVEQNYLEIRILDFSRKTIPNTFMSHYQQRLEHADFSDRVVYERLNEQARKITVCSFFRPGDFWQQYNSIPENVVHHYGLQMFDSFVNNYSGYFRVRSQDSYRLHEQQNAYYSMGDFPEIYNEIGIPGTQYETIIPFQTDANNENTSLNVNINYTESLLKDYEKRDFKSFRLKIEEIINKQSNNESRFQVKKEQLILELEEEFRNKVLTDNLNTIIYCPADTIPVTMIELFCKMLMLYIANTKGQPCNIMITGCTDSHMVEITRMFALFYDKQGTNSLMKYVQIYLCGVREYEEFLISGENIAEFISRTEKLAFARGTHGECVRLLKLMLGSRQMVPPKSNVEIVPFDMLEYEVGQPSLFASNVKKVLETDVQSEKFGCKLSDLHVRIGSTIHIQTFYEAELLFHNNYYTSRFAYWISNQLKLNQEIDFTKKVTLVGYENYSELLLYELREILRSENKNIDYIVYEQKSLEKFRAEKEMYEYWDHQFVLIVPINSTTTTHRKLAAFLKSSIVQSMKDLGNTEFGSNYKIRKIVNLGVILISNEGDKIIPHEAGGEVSINIDEKDEEIQNKYWKRSKEAPNILLSEVLEEKFYFLIEVRAKWHLPLECQACFPLDDFTKESPLIETNKESIVPMQAIGIKKDKKCKNFDFSVENNIEFEKIRELSEFLIYDHIERCGNHFNYYFATERVWSNITLKQKIISWLDKNGEEYHNLYQFNPNKVYDIIVSPLHFSNAVFIEEVNKHFFGNAALILHFDVEKEFRTNIIAKYSNILQLYQNLRKENKESVINFHFVDDTIVSGKTFFRAKSLIESFLTPKEGEGKVAVNIFKSIILLLNRLSSASQKNYISETNQFYAYFNLKISSMRNHEDACILCKKHDDWFRLAEQASLNEVYLYWRKKGEDLECKSIDRYRESNNDERQQRVCRRMLCSHKAAVLFAGICDCYSAIEVEDAIIKHLLVPVGEGIDLENVISYLKVLGRPFLNFRREQREASFSIMLKMIDHLLQENFNVLEEEKNDFDKLIGVIYSDKKTRTRFIIILLNRLVELGSNYIIRKRTMDRLLQYVKECQLSPDLEREFRTNYLNRIKQLIGQSNDAVKCLYLEYLLLYGREFETEKKYIKEEEYLEMKLPSETDDEAAFLRCSFFENTKVLSQGINILVKCLKEDGEAQVDKLLDTINDYYYFENLIQYMSFHKMIKKECNGDRIEFQSPREGNKLIGMVELERQFERVLSKEKVSSEPDSEKQEHSGVLIDEYKEMISSVRKAVGAIDVEIIIPYRKKSASQFICLDLRKSKALDNFINGTSIGLYIKGEQKLEGDTYKIITEGGNNYVLIKYCDAKENDNGISEIYMLLLIKDMVYSELLSSLKNLFLFRHKIWKLFNLSSSTLLQNWVDNLWYKQQITKPRAMLHCRIDEQIEKLNLVSRLIELDKKTEEYDSDSKVKKSTADEVLNMVVNNMIGYLNTRVLADEIWEDKTSSKTGYQEPFANFWYYYADNFDIVSEAWKMRLISNRGERFGGDSISSLVRTIKGSGGKSIPVYDKLFMLILAVLQSAIKNGVTREDGIKDIYIFEEEGDLWIANEYDESKRESLQKMISAEDSWFRVGDGISQAVVYDFFCVWYGAEACKGMFCIQEKKLGNNSGMTNVYGVKLPMLEAEELGMGKDGKHEI